VDIAICSKVWFRLADSSDDEAVDLTANSSDEDEASVNPINLATMRTCFQAWRDARGTFADVPLVKWTKVRRDTNQDARAAFAEHEYVCSLPTFQESWAFLSTASQLSLDQVLATIMDSNFPAGWRGLAMYHFHRVLGSRFPGSPERRVSIARSFLVEAIYRNSLFPYDDQPEWKLLSDPDISCLREGNTNKAAELFAKYDVLTLGRVLLTVGTDFYYQPIQHGESYPGVHDRGWLKCPKDASSIFGHAPGDPNRKYDLPYHALGGISAWCKTGKVCISFFKHVHAAACPS
jgi:hypothetical protein